MNNYLKKSLFLKWKHKNYIKYITQSQIMILFYKSFKIICIANKKNKKKSIVQ